MKNTEQALRLTIRGIMAAVAALMLANDLGGLVGLWRFIKPAAFGQGVFVVAVAATAAMPLVIAAQISLRALLRRRGELARSERLLDGELWACSAIWVAWTSWLVIGGAMMAGAML